VLICAEGTRLLENAIAFSSCVGGTEEEIQCPAGVRSRRDPAGACAEEKEKRKRLVQPRQALEGLTVKSVFDFIVRTEATRGARR
jgi:hypothetical protein